MFPAISMAARHVTLHASCTTDGAVSLWRGQLYVMPWWKSCRFLSYLCFRKPTKLTGSRDLVMFGRAVLRVWLGHLK